MQTSFESPPLPQGPVHGKLSMLANNNETSEACEIRFSELVARTTSIKVQTVMGSKQLTGKMNALWDTGTTAYIYFSHTSVSLAKFGDF